MGTTKFVFAVLVAVPFAVALACGGGQSTTETPQGGSASASASTPPSATASASASATTTAVVAWKDMDHGAKLAFMKNTVLPKMKDEFAAADPKKWGDINCVTCHGDAAKAGTFKMPNAKLPLVGKDNFQKLQKDKPDAMKFMMTKVVPDMAALLGEDPFDPKTGKGFGCHNCHADKAQ